MIKDILKANETVRPGDKRVAALKELYPSCFGRDGSFNFDELKRLLNGKVSFQNEGYGLNFLGKSYARLLASLDTTTVITPDTAHNEQPENADSDNIYISGDNLDALKHLLKSYEGQVKCIYIDPPYNTGSDGFVYNDSFHFTAEDLAEKLSIEQEEAEKILDLTKRKSASHSAWLLFMAPRLTLARDLLTPDGVIFISIDENEHSNLKLLCDGIFGEENYAGEIIWKNSSKNDQAYISMQNEYILAYVKSKDHNPGNWVEYKQGTDEIFKAFAGFKKKYGNDEAAIHKAALAWYKQFPPSNPIYDSKHYAYMDERGVYFPDNIAGPNFGQYVYDVVHPVTHKVCKAPESGWRFPKAEMEQRIKDGRVAFGPDETTIPKKKTYLADTLVQGLTSIKYKDGRAASKQLTELMGCNCFTNPKDTDLLATLFRAIGLQDGDIVCDFFAGSSSTVEALQKVNPNLRYILVQIPENMDETLKVTHGGGAAVLKNAIALCDSLHVPHTVDQIGMERIRKLRERALREEGTEVRGDWGFRHFILREPDAKTIDEIEDFSPESSADLFLGNDLYAAFGKETILATWLIRDGYHFAKKSEVEELDFAGYRAYYIRNHVYLVDPGMNEEAVEALMDRYGMDPSFKPTHVVVFGYNFTWTELENLKTNLTHFRDTEDNLRVTVDVRY